MSKAKPEFTAGSLNDSTTSAAALPAIVPAVEDDFRKYALLPK